MKDQVLLSANGHLCVGIPLFRISAQEQIDLLEGYNIILSNSEPIAFVIETSVGPIIMSSGSVKRRFEFLGALDDQNIL